MREREAGLAALWAAGAWRGRPLRTESGVTYTVLYEGRRGGGPGPDFRDAVLQGADGSRVYGDVELHVRASSWHAHGHAADPRYNGVVLHAVLRVAGGERKSPLANGTTTPVVVLRASAAPAGRSAVLAWPCAPLAEPERRLFVRSLLESAGQARFEARVRHFAGELASATGETASEGGWGYPDRVLWTALAEGLGYGRNRQALRELGLRLARGTLLEEVLVRADRLGRVERLRATGLAALQTRWLESGPWDNLRRALATEDARGRERALLVALRVENGAVSRGRALIVAANVALPFGVAWSRLSGESRVEAHARELYASLPGLPSNAITRTMRGQLGLPRLPSRAREHQGLHNLWATFCQRKRCAECPCALFGTGRQPHA